MHSISVLWGKKYKNKIKIIFADIDSTSSYKNGLFSEETIKSIHPCNPSDKT